MEEAPENGKELSHFARNHGMDWSIRDTVCDSPVVQPVNFMLRYPECLKVITDKVAPLHVMKI
jgi:hypothetical protein